MKNIFAFIIHLMLLYPCVYAQQTNLGNNIFYSEYYFIVQIHTLKSDTISYDVIEIYSSHPKLLITDINGENSEIDIEEFPLSSFKKGYIKGMKKKQIGGVMVLFTKENWIENDNFVKFDFVNKKYNIVFSRMYRLGSRR